MKLSAVICSYNRDKYIKTSVRSLAEQTLAKNEYEIIIVNNNSTDRTDSYCKELVDELKDKVNLKYVVETNQGLSYARNRGIAEATGGIITYIDDDGVAEPSLLEDIVDTFESNSNYVGIGGKVIPIYETEEPKWLSYHTRMMVTHIDYGEKKFKCYGKKYPPGCNMSYKKEVLEKVGGFNESLKWRVDDKYIFLEVSKLSDEVYFIPKLKVGHNIDAERVTDKSFDILSVRLGAEERLRVLSLGRGAYYLKVIDYLIKYFACYVFYFKFLIQGIPIKGRYLLRMRRLALKGLLERART